MTEIIKINGGIKFDWYGKEIKIVSRTAGDEGAVVFTVDGVTKKDYSWGTNHTNQTAAEYLNAKFVDYWVNPTLQEIADGAGETPEPEDWEEIERNTRLFTVEMVQAALQRNPTIVGNALVL